MTKSQLRIDAVSAGSEHDLHHFLESVVLQANAAFREEQADAADDGRSEQDQQMTEVFRALATDRPLHGDHRRDAEPATFAARRREADHHVVHAPRGKEAEPIEERAHVGIQRQQIVEVQRDGLVGAAGFYCTFTSSAADGIESWLRDWIDSCVALDMRQSKPFAAWLARAS